MNVKLVLFKKDGSKKSFPINRSSVVIGRSHNCDFQIPVMSVSKKHCKLTCKADTLNITDMDSRNGTLLNGKMIDKAQVYAGDSIEIGPLVFVVQINDEPKVIKNPKLPEDENQPEKPIEENVPKQKTDDASKKEKQNVDLSDLDTENLSTDDLLDDSDLLDLEELGDLSDLGI